MMFMYAPRTALKPPSTTVLSPKLITLHMILRKSLAPREGDAIAYPSYERNFIKYIKGHEDFNAFDYILMEFWNIVVNPLRSCGYVPQIMCMIEKVIDMTFVKDVEHKTICPQVP
jgi:hypothetical protein